MPEYGWRSESGVEGWLYAEPYRFEFFQAVRLLEQFALNRPHAVPNQPHAAPSQPQFASNQPHAAASASSAPSADAEPAALLRAYVGFDFPPSELRSIQPAAAVSGRPELTANLYALAGSAAPLPDWVAELLHLQERLREHAMRDFLDIFHHRLLTLLYRIRLRHRPWLQPQAAGARVENRMAGYLLSFAGLGLPELQNRLGVSDWELLPYAGLLWQRPRSLIGLQRILAHALAVPIHTRPLLGTWSRIEPEDRTRLGRRNRALGRTTVLGGRIWNPQGRFDVLLGPLTFTQFLALLPGRALHRRTSALVRFYAGEQLKVRVQLDLDAEAIPPTRLGHSRLGWTSWLKEGARSAPAAAYGSSSKVMLPAL